MLSFYRVILLFKFVGVILYAGGLAGSFLATDFTTRKRAVHSIASPALLLVWVAGYVLTTQLQVPLTELWILGGLLFSLISMLALVYSVAREGRRNIRTLLWAAMPLFWVLVFMVFRPTWATLGRP